MRVALSPKVGGDVTVAVGHAETQRSVPQAPGSGSHHSRLLTAASRSHSQGPELAPACVGPTAANWPCFSGGRGSEPWSIRRSWWHHCSRPHGGPGTRKDRPPPFLFTPELGTPAHSNTSSLLSRHSARPHASLALAEAALTHCGHVPTLGAWPLGSSITIVSPEDRARGPGRTHVVS